MFSTKHSNKRPPVDSPTGPMSPTQNPELNETLTKVVNAVNMLSEKVQQMHSGLEAVKTQLSEIPVLNGCPPWFHGFMSDHLKTVAASDNNIPSLAFTTFVIREAAKASEKSLNAVVERLPDTPDRTETVLDKDLNFIKEVCSSAGISPPISVWRQPTKNTKRDRPLKVHFASKKDRDQFIFKFRSNLPKSAKQNGVNPGCRRDMTVPELQMLYALRKQVWELNTKAGKMAFYVRDLDVAECKDPRPLLVKT